MDSEYLQLLRYKLQKRLKKLNSAPFTSFHGTLVQSWWFLQENEITRAILEELERRSGEHENGANLTIGGQYQIGDTEAENDGICYWVVKKCVLSSSPELKSTSAITYQTKPNMMMQLRPSALHLSSPYLTTSTNISTTSARS